jgi:putative PIG3 family NAD(P)H quinone oxidoreductase
MRAAVVTRPGGPEVLAIEERPAPKPGPFDLLVAVEASACNRADLLQRRGLYPAPPGAPPDILGLELAGTVVSVGSAVTRFGTGARVMAVVGGGASADLAVVHEREAMRVPEGLSTVEAAAVPEAFLSAYDAAVLQGGLESGRLVGVNAASSGVGTALTQICRATGARAIGSTRSPDKLARLRALGVETAVLGGSSELARACLERGGADLIVDLVGGPGTAQLLDAVNSRGVLVLVGLMGGSRAEIDLARLLRQRLRVQGTVLRGRPPEEKMALAQRFEATLVPRFEGPYPALGPVIDRVLPLDAIADAHRAMEANQTFGKIVLDHRT